MKKIFLFILAIFLSTVAYADVNNPLSVTEEDGSPDTYPWRVKFPNGTVTDNADGTTSISITADAVVGPTPATATDSAIAAWDGTTGRLLKNTNLITGSSFISYGTAGVRLTGDGDGALAFDGLGNGSDENLTLNLDDTSNEATLSSTTGVTLVNLSGMNLATGGSGIPNITLGSGSTANTTITSDVSGTDTSINFGSGIASFSHDISVSGDDIFMATNTKGGLLVATGTSFTPLAVGAINGMVLSVDSTTASGLRWGFVGGGGSGTPGGSNTQVQFNDSSSFGGDSGFVYNKTTDNLSIAGDMTISGDDIFMTTNTKGNLLVADGTNYNTFTVGANGTVLSADSNATDGVAWKTITQHKTFVNLPVHSAKLSADISTRLDGGIGTGATPYVMWRLLFDDNTENNPSKNIALWQGRMDDNWQGGPLSAKIDFFMLSSDSTSTAGGNITFGVSVWAITSGDAVNLTTESFATENSKSQLVPTVMSRDETMTIPITNTDGLAAGDWFVVKLRRDGSDTITGDAGVISFALTE